MARGATQTLSAVIRSLHLTVTRRHSQALESGTGQTSFTNGHSLPLQPLSQRVQSLSASTSMHTLVRMSGRVWIVHMYGGSFCYAMGITLFIYTYIIFRLYNLHLPLGLPHCGSLGLVKARLAYILLTRPNVSLRKGQRTYGPIKYNQPLAYN